MSGANTAPKNVLGTEIGVIALDRRASLGLKRLLPYLLSPQNNIRRISDYNEALDELKLAHLHAVFDCREVRVQHPLSRSSRWSK